MLTLEQLVGPEATKEILSQAQDELARISKAHDELAAIIERHRRRSGDGAAPENDEQGQDRGDESRPGG